MTKRRGTDNTMAKRYQRVNQNPYIEEGQTTQWPKDTKGVIRIRISKMDRQHNGQRYHRGNQNPYIEEGQKTQWPKDTKGVIRIRISKNRKHNGQNIPQGLSESYIEEGQTTQWSKEKVQKTNNDLQNINRKLVKSR